MSFRVLPKILILVALFLIVSLVGYKLAKIQTSSINLSKIDPRLLEDPKFSYVMNPDGTLNVIVRFYDNISEGMAKTIVKKYGVVTNIFSYDDLKQRQSGESDFLPYDKWHRVGISVQEKSLVKLASEDAIRDISMIEGSKVYGNEPLKIVQHNETK